MHASINQKLLDLLNDTIEPLQDGEHKYDSLLDKIGDARFVLIGEATHGTHEFYRERAEITRQLILKKGFKAVAIEGDLPDVYRIHQYLQGMGDRSNSIEALSAFKRFPEWMWRNSSILPFLQWLRIYNDRLATSVDKIGFYGLDLYSLHASMQAVIDYLTKVDPEAAERAKQRYACFDHLSCDPQTYGHLTSMKLKNPCIKEAIEQVIELQHHAFKYIKKGLSTEDEYFYAAQNARLVKDAESYYRSMFEGRISTWNIRDTHMMKSLSMLIEHLEKKSNEPAKAIVWAHNSHVGDASATEMHEMGEVNIGQLARETLGNTDTFLIGFSTHHGVVTAADDWGLPAKFKQINPGMTGSYEELFHHLKHKNFLLSLNDNDHLEHYFNLPRLQRAIGVIYRPETERGSHYFFTRLPYQFDCVIHIDETTAVQPLNNIIK